MRSSAARPGPVQRNVAIPTGTATAAQSRTKPSGWSYSQTEAARNSPAPRTPALGRHHALQHRHEPAARRPQHGHQRDPEQDRHGERLSDRRHLALAQVRDAGCGGEELSCVDPAVGLEDHRLGGRHGSGHRLRETPRRQRRPPGRDLPRPAAAWHRPSRHVERALQLEACVQQVRDGLEAVDPRLPAHDERGTETAPRIRRPGDHAGSPA